MEKKHKQQQHSSFYQVLFCSENFCWPVDPLFGFFFFFLFVFTLILLIKTTQTAINSKQNTKKSASTLMCASCLSNQKRTKPIELNFQRKMFNVLFHSNGNILPLDDAATSHLTIIISNQIK